MYQGKYTSSQPSPKAPARRRKKRISRGTILFYSIYGLLTTAAIVAILCAMPALRNWLTKFEASQPDHKRDEVFAQLFEDPDWAKLYDMAGIRSSKFENSTTFDAYMTNLVGDRKLNLLEISAGLSGDKKYIVRLEDQKIACFTLTGGSENQTEIQQWELGSLELFFTANQTVTVERFPGQTVYINGLPLDDSYTIQKVSTVAQAYLPEGVNGYRSELQQVTGLLNQPDVKVMNPDGSAAQIMYDAEKAQYHQLIPTLQPSDEEKALARSAVETYAKYMIRKASMSDIRKCFMTGSKIYSTIASSEVGWTQSFDSYSFTEPQFLNFYRYSEDVFSIRVVMTLEVKRKNGSIKEYDLNNELIFQKDASGKYMVFEMTNVELQQRKQEVRLTFLNGDSMISSQFVDAYAKSLTLPSVEGLTAWVKKEVASSGKVTLTVVYDADTQVNLPGDVALEPMTLYAYFEKVAENP